MAACEPWNERLSAWVDGEASTEERGAVEDHLAHCAACARAALAYVRLGGRVRAVAARSARGAPVGGARGRRAGVRVAVAAVVAACVVAALRVGSRAPGGDERVLADAELRHRQAFARAEPCELPSAVPEVVGAWLRDRTGRAVVVPIAVGARLLGARTCRIAGDVTAHVLYRDGDRSVSLLAPAAGTQAARVADALASAPDPCTVRPDGGRVCGVRTRTGPALAVGDEAPARLLAFTE